MSREERTRSLPLLDRDVVSRVEVGERDIGSELFGLGGVAAGPGRQESEERSSPSGYGNGNVTGQIPSGLPYREPCPEQVTVHDESGGTQQTAAAPSGPEPQRMEDRAGAEEKEGKMVSGNDQGVVPSEEEKSVPVHTSPPKPSDDNLAGEAAQEFETKPESGIPWKHREYMEQGTQGEENGRKSAEPASLRQREPQRRPQPNMIGTPDSEGGTLESGRQARWGHEETVLYQPSGRQSNLARGQAETGYHYPPAGKEDKSYPAEPRYHYPKLAMPDMARGGFPKKMISVYSPKGGVGKSTISKELAMAYSTAIVNGEPVRVLLLDGDWEFGDVSTLFNVAPRPNIMDWIRDMQAEKRQSGHLHICSSDTILSRYIIPYSSTLHLLAGPGDPAEAEMVTEEMVMAVIESLRRADYDIIIIDSANSNRARTLVPLMRSDAVVLVETLDTSTVAETTAVLNTLRSKQFDFGKLYMVLNQVPQNDAQIDISVTEISRLLQLDVAAVLPKYELMRMINNAGEAAVSKRASAYSQAIFQLANRMVPLFGEGKKKKSMFGFLGRFKRNR